jgi:hypothetical protein
MKDAITSVYAVIASWTPWIVVSRSATICEIDTFMALLSSTITNCADAKIAIGSPSPALAPSLVPASSLEALMDCGRAESGAGRGPPSGPKVAGTDRQDGLSRDT